MNAKPPKIARLAAGRGMKWVYRGAMAGTAICLLCMALFSSAETLYTGAAALEVESADPDLDARQVLSPAVVERLLFSDSLLANTIEQAAGPMSGGEARALVERVRASLQISAGREKEDADRQLIWLHYVETDRKRCQKIVAATAAAMADRINADLKAPLVRRHGDARSGAARLKEAWDAKQKQIAARTATALAEAEKIYGRKPAATPKPKTAERVIVNPLWTRRKQEVEAARLEYSRLLTRVTPAHPTAKEVAGRIEALVQDLAAVPEKISAAGAEDQVDADSAAPPPAAAGPKIGLKHTEQLAAMQQEAQELHEQWQRYVEAERESWDNLQRFRAIVHVRALADTEEFRQRKIAGVSVWGSLALGLMAMCGLVVASHSGEATLASPAQAASLLKIPVLATIDSPVTAEGAPARRRARRWARWATSGGECFVALVVLWFGTLAVLDGQLARTLISSPLDGYLLEVERLVSLWR